MCTSKLVSKDIILQKKSNSYPDFRNPLKWEYGILVNYVRFKNCIYGSIDPKIKKI